jgi:TonB family protein
MNTIQIWLLSYLLNSLWQVPLLFAAGWLAARTLKPLGATAEHRLWVSVLLGQALLPAASTLPPELIGRLSARIGALLAILTSAPRAANPQVSVIMGSGAGLAALHIAPVLLTAIAIAYATATIYFAARFLWRCRRLHTLRRESTPIVLTGKAALYWAECREYFGFDDKFAIGQVAIAASTRLHCPVTTGLTRKLLLLPETMVTDLPEADLRTVIAHEFAHMQRNDFLKNLIYELLALPASYHPALWLTRDRIMETREVVCDQIAAPISASLGPDSIDSLNEYARSLLRLASLLVTGMPTRTPHAIGIFDAHAFERRLMQLTQQPIQIRASRRFVLIAACTVLGLATCASALALRLSVNALPASTDRNAKSSDALSVSPTEMAANVVTKVPPKYPEEAKKERIQGAVFADDGVEQDGAVEELTVASGPKELQQSSLDAVRQWTYKPYLLNGDAVEVKTTISVIYSLAK